MCSSDLQKTFIDVKGLTIFNPPGFGEKLMADIPEVYVDFDLPAFLKGKVHLERLSLNLNEFIVIKSADGGLNVNSISGISEPQITQIKDADYADKKRKPEIKIDILELKVGRVLYRDYTQSPAGEFRYQVNIDERYENVTDVEKLVKLIVTRSLVNTAISRLAELDFDSDVFGAIQNIGKQLEGIFGEKESQ